MTEGEHVIRKGLPSELDTHLYLFVAAQRLLLFAIVITMILYVDACWAAATAEKSAVVWWTWRTPETVVNLAVYGLTWSGLGLARIFLPPAMSWMADASVRRDRSIRGFESREAS